MCIQLAENYCHSMLKRVKNKTEKKREQTNKQTSTNNNNNKSCNRRRHTALHCAALKIYYNLVK